MPDSGQLTPWEAVVIVPVVGFPASTWVAHTEFLAASYVAQPQLLRTFRGRTSEEIFQSHPQSLSLPPKYK